MLSLSILRLGSRFICCRRSSALSLPHTEQTPEAPPQLPLTRRPFRRPILIANTVINKITKHNKNVSILVAYATTIFSIFADFNSYCPSWVFSGYLSIDIIRYHLTTFVIQVEYVFFVEIF